MPSYVYVAAQDDNHIAVFTINDETGGLTPQAAIPMAGGPSLLAMSPNRHCLYVGHRTVPEISSHRIDPGTGGLTRLGSVAPPDSAGFLATDRSGHIAAGGLRTLYVSRAALALRFPAHRIRRRAGQCFVLCPGLMGQILI